jgi:hypothetical protein
MNVSLENILFEELITGTISLYHYARSTEDQLILDPSKFGNNSYTRRDKMISDVPRVFFYLKPQEKETMFDTKQVSLYTTEVPSDLIYDIIKDPEGIRIKAFEKRPDFDLMLKNIIKAGYKGCYYKPGFEVVAWFEPIKVRKMSDEERLSLESPTNDITPIQPVL